MAEPDLQLEPVDTQVALLRVQAALQLKNAREASLEQRLADIEARNALLVQQLAESKRAESQLATGIARTTYHVHQVQLATGMVEQYRATASLHGLRASLDRSLEQRLAYTGARNILLVQQQAESHRAESQLATGMVEQYRATAVMHGLQKDGQCGGAAS